MFLIGHWSFVDIGDCWV